VRAVLLALVLAAIGVTLVLTLTAGAANTPQDTVRRWLQPRSIHDACAQFAPDSRPGILQCARAAGSTPPNDLVFSHVVIDGNHAAVQADFTVGRDPVEEHFRLVKLHGAWLITFDR
jgi:hypothetical protein